MSFDAYAETDTANTPQPSLGDVREAGHALSSALDSDRPLDVTCRTLSQITEHDECHWEAFRKAKAAFQSPFMSLSFLRHAQAIGRQVEIAVICQDRQVVGYLPFERQTRRWAIPVAGRMNDVHGVLGADLNRVQLLDVLKQCQLDGMDFHAWFGSEAGIADFAFEKIDSFMADLEAEKYSLYSEFLTRERYTLKQQIRKTRKFERDIGKVRLEFRNTDNRMLEQLIQWKRQQWQRTHTFDIFSVPWTTDLVRSLFQAPGDASVRGVLSVLWVEDEPAAMHVGIQEGDLLHYWFPVYDTRYRQFSPGAEMFLRISDACQTEEGVRKIDLGYGEQPYKHKLINRKSTCYHGSLTGHRLQFQRRKLAYQGHQYFRTLPFKESIKTAVRAVMPNLGRRRFQ